MVIKHILKDGTVLESVAGHTVRAEDASVVYQLIKSINEGSKDEDSKEGS